MRRNEWRVLLLALTALLFLAPASRSVHAEPAQFELACASSRLYLLDMLLVCDGAYAWCWSGWNYSSDGGGFAHYTCGGMN